MGITSIKTVVISALIASVCTALPAQADDAAISVTTSAVVNGWPAGMEEVHGTVEVLRAYSHRGYCTGTLIAPQLVVTAAHCVVHWDDHDVDNDGDEEETLVTRPEQILIGAGYLNRNDRSDGELVGVSRIVVHEDFDLRFRRGVTTKTGIGKPHDIALLVLDVPVVSISPVAIPSDTMVDVRKHDSATVSGYGVSDEQAASGELRVTQAWIEKVERYEILTNAPSADYGDSCFGDSGGPLYRTLDGVTYLVGVVSRMRADADVDCGEGGIYTRTVNYRSWVIDQMGAADQPEPSIPSGFDLAALPETNAEALALGYSNGCTVATHKATTYESMVASLGLLLVALRLRRRSR